MNTFSRSLVALLGLWAAGCTATAEEIAAADGGMDTGAAETSPSTEAGADVGSDAAIDVIADGAIDTITDSAVVDSAIGADTATPTDTSPTTDTAVDDGPVDPKESVVKKSTACIKSPGAASRCDVVEVTCEGLPAMTAELAIYEPSPGVPYAGTILFGSGGGGDGFYNFRKMADLRDKGYRVIDRRWPELWFTGGTTGPQQTSCRLGALIRYVKTTIATPATTPLCATGNSGGSAELGYALTWHRAGASLDFAMPTSGPFHRLDLACDESAEKTWVSTCKSLLTSRCPTCAARSCELGVPRTLIDTSYGATSKKCSLATAADWATLKAGSPILGPSAKTLDSVPAKILIGQDDGGPYAPLATALVDALKATGANISIDYIVGAPHEIDTTEAGAKAVLNNLLASCKKR